jgi:hypothetical protein
MNIYPLAALLGLAFAASNGSAASLNLGQTLSAAERQSLTSGNPVQLGQEQFVPISPKLTPKNSSPNSETWLLNSQGVVGRSNHEVMVGQIDTEQVKAALTARDMPKLVSAHYYASTQISNLRYANLADAARASTLLSSRLPKASITVPVQYSRPRAR